MNAPSIILLLLIAAAVGFIIYRRFAARDRRHRSCCDCGEEGCAMRDLAKEAHRCKSEKK